MSSKKKNHKSWNVFGDWALVIVLTVVDLGLIVVAKDYFDSLNHLASRSVAALSPDREAEALEQLRQIAERGSWDQFENARAEKAAYYVQASLQPSPGSILYFFPEVLPKESLENDFVQNEIKPELDALKNAYQKKEKKNANQALRVLKSRVKNYELGASESEEHLSEEAKKFLDVYSLFSKE